MQPTNPFLNQPPQPGVPPVAPATPVQYAVPGTQPVPVTVPQPVAQQASNLGSGANQPSKVVPKNPNSTQSTLQLSEVRDNMVIMIDGSMRAVVACKSINFDLMSEREREGVEYSYQNFLNSLNFPIQILIRSQRVDIGPYLDKLVTTRRTQDNMLLGVLMDDYINYIDTLSQEANIMEKTFYIVVPYFPQGDVSNFIEQGKGFFGKLLARPKNAVTRIDTAAYQKAKEEIKNRVDNVIAGMFQIGVQSTQLDTKSLGELYYNFYNPDTAVRQPLGDFENSTGIYTKKAGPASAPTGVPQ
ncbi:hypothetical protein H7200_00020 [Candidatus Saccharibacteria bacterium]|nr:hypothetical protein [Candidatus Saccharibacteria bacterium]